MLHHFPVESFGHDSSDDINIKYPKPQPQSTRIKENTSRSIPREKIKFSNYIRFNPTTWDLFVVSSD